MQAVKHNCGHGHSFGMSVAPERTLRQKHGELAEKAVSKYCSCPKCKKSNAKLKPLRSGFTGADVICDFCGYLAQVKGATSKGKIGIVPGAAWKPQKERLNAGIYFPVFVVKIQNEKPISIHYIAADFLEKRFYKPGNRPRRIESGRPPGKPRLHWMFNFDFRKLDQNRIIKVWVCP